METIFRVPGIVYYTVVLLSHVVEILEKRREKDSNQAIGPIFVPREKRF